MHDILILSALVSVISTRDWRKIVVYDGEVVPSLLDIVEDTPVRLHCGSLSPVKWTYRKYGSNKYTFLSHNRNITPLPFQFRVIHSSIIINNLSPSDSGLVYCQGTYITRAGNDHAFVNYTAVNVLDFMPFACVIPNIVEVSVGDHVQLFCGTDKGVEWFGLRLRNLEKTIVHNTIILRNLRKEHSGPYVCRGVYHHKIFHSRATVVVEGYIHRWGRSPVAIAA